MTITDGRTDTEAAMRPLARVDEDELVAQSGWVRAVARNLVRDPSRAEDVAQETLLAALANPPRDAADARRLRAWLARVAFNLSRLGSRQVARRTAREQRVARQEHVPSVSDELECAGTRQALAVALADLPDAYRDVIELRYFDGLSTAEIAVRTGGSELAVRKRLWRARLRLRDALDRELEGGARILAALVPWRALRRGGAATAPAVPLAVASGLAAGVLLSLGWLGTRALRDAPVVAALVPGVPAAGGERVAAEGIASPPIGRPTRLHVPERTPVPPERPPVTPDRDAEESRAEARTPLAASHRGTVVDLEGRPRAGIELFASGDPRDGSTRALARSDELGAFRVKSDGTSLVLEARSAELATVVRAAFDPRQPGEPQLVVVAPSFALSGSVVGEDGRALGGARVELTCRESAFAGIDHPVQLDSAVLRALLADEAGRFAARDLPRGRDLFVEIRSPGYAPLAVETPSLAGEARFVLRALPPEHIVAGTVVHRDGSPAAGALVRLGRESTTADAGGRFQLVVGDVAPEAPLQASDGTAAPAVVRDFGALLRAVDTGAAARSVELELGEPHDAVHGRLSGPEPGGWLLAAFREDDGARDTEGPVEPDALTYSDPSGAFELRLPRGSYALHALAPSAARVASRHGLESAGGDWELTVPAAPAATVAGRVLADDGRPLALAVLEVRVRLDDGRHSLRWGEVASDALGAFALPAAPGLALEVLPRHPSAAPQAFAFTAAEGAAPLALVVDRRAFVRIAGGDAERCTLLDADGRALAFRGPLGDSLALAPRDGLSPALEVPPAARWLAVEKADVGPELVALDPVPGEVLEIRF